MKRTGPKHEHPGWAKEMVLLKSVRIDITFFQENTFYAIMNRSRLYANLILSKMSRKFHASSSMAYHHKCYKAPL